VRASIPRHRRPAFLLLCSGLALVVALVAGTARADDPDTLRGEAERLRAANAALDRDQAQALLELYALESSLQRAERRAAVLRERIAELEEREASARHGLDVAKTSERSAQQALADRVLALYVEGQPNPLEVILGASSLDELVDAIDSVNRLADHDERIIGQLQNARRELRVALRRLAQQETELRDLAADAEAAREGLVRARNEKTDYIASLARQAELNSRQIDSLTARAQAAEQEATEISADAAPPEPAPDAETPTEQGPAPSATDSSPEPGRQVTVSATKYCLTGTTATGLPVQHGVIATDPAYIPLGTRLFVPGYGEGVAADTGGAVKGWTIDLWVASCAEAGQFGRQTLTVTIFD
jgi:3D (Asp-Asp-Asp) domain-containing protein/flagellar motility protein MotE (MotC chaperone)